MVPAIRNNRCDHCPLQRLPVFRGIDKATWEQFDRLRTARPYSRGNILFYNGNQPLGMYFLCSGRVKVVKTDSRQRAHIARIVESPDILGDRAFIAGEPYVGTGEVMEESRVCFLETKHFEKLFLSKPGVCLELARRFARELGQAEEKARDLALKTIRSRLAKHLLDLLASQTASRHTAADRVLPHGSVSSESRRSSAALSLNESRLELAEILGTSPEAICRSLAEFRNKGLIAAKGRLVRILNAERLRQVAES